MRARYNATSSVSNEHGRFAILHRVIPWRGSHLTMPGSVGHRKDRYTRILSGSQLSGGLQPNLSGPTKLEYIAHQSFRRHLYPSATPIFQEGHSATPIFQEGHFITNYLALHRDLVYLCLRRLRATIKHKSELIIIKPNSFNHMRCIIATICIP